MAARTQMVERSNKRRRLSPTEGTTKKSKQIRKAAKSQISIDEGVPAPESHQLRPDLNEVEVPSVKDLASSEASIRRAAFKRIITHLDARPATSALSKTQCSQLWRGFFVAVYMHDSKNALSVQNLLKEIAGTFSTISSKDDQLARSHDDEAQTTNVAQNVWLDSYHGAFHETLVREWSGIDSHRMNKYLLLVRFALRELSTICLRPLLIPNSEAPKAQITPKKRATLSTTQARLDANSIMHLASTVGPLNPVDRRIPDGLRLHVLDVFPDEIFDAASALRNEGHNLSKAELTELEATLDILRLPLEAMSKSDSGAQRHIRIRAKEAVSTFRERQQELLDALVED